MNTEEATAQAYEWMDALLIWITTAGVDFLVSLVVALLIFVIGKWIAGKLTAGIRKAMGARDVDPVLISFVANLVYYILLIAVVLAAIKQVGIETTSFIAVLGAAGLAVGFALQGSLSNFASGVLIILFRPFKLGDFVDAGGAAGIVEEIGILVCIMRSPDNKKIIVPNSAIMSGNITNFTGNDTRRVDMTFSCAYSDDVDQVRTVLTEIASAHPKVLQDPAPQIVIAAHGASSIDFAVRPWCATSDYWDVFFDIHREVKVRFDKEGISIPFPQQDVHMHQVN